MFGEVLFQAPGNQDARRVGQTLDSGADFADFRRRLEDMDVVAS